MRLVKSSERVRNQVAPLKDDDTDVRMELSGRDEARQDEDASVEVEMMAHEAMDQEMRDGERKECEIVGLQGSEPVAVMRNVRGAIVGRTGAPRGHGARGLCCVVQILREWTRAKWPPQASPKGTHRKDCTCDEIELLLYGRVCEECTRPGKRTRERHENNGHD